MINLSGRGGLTRILTGKERKDTLRGPLTKLAYGTSIYMSLDPWLATWPVSGARPEETKWIIVDA